MKLWRFANSLLDRVSDVLWRMFEVHIFKIIVFAIFFSCVNEVMPTCRLLILLHFLLLMAVTLLVGRQKGHPACKKWGDGGGGHMSQFEIYFAVNEK